MTQDRYIAWLVRGILKPSRSGPPTLEYRPNQPTTITWPGKRFSRSVKRHTHTAEHCQAVFGRKFPLRKELLTVLVNLGFRTLWHRQIQISLDGEAPSRLYSLRYNNTIPVLLIRQYDE